jgi:hypothetical protein
MKNKRVVFLILYIGEYPWYFSYFLHSCKYNPSIDFYIYTDNPIIDSSTPENVRLIPYSLNEFNKDAAKALGFLNMVINCVTLNRLMDIYSQIE